MFRCNIGAMSSTQYIRYTRQFPVRNIELSISIYWIHRKTSARRWTASRLTSHSPPGLPARGGEDPCSVANAAAAARHGYADARVAAAQGVGRGSSRGRSDHRRGGFRITGGQSAERVQQGTAGSAADTRRRSAEDLRP